MKFLWALMLVGGIACSAETVVKSNGVEFRDAVLSPAGENVKISTVYGDKVVAFKDIDPIEIRTKDRVYKGYRLEKIEPERIVIGQDGMSLRIKADELDNDCRRLFGYPVAETTVASVDTPEKQNAETADAAKEPIQKSAFYLAGEDFRNELVQARTGFAIPAAPAVPPPRQSGQYQSQNRSYSSANVTRNIVFIEDEGKSAGSGFICSLWGVPVIVTNAHVFVTAEKPLIQDGMHNSYEPRAVLVSPDRDIAIIKVDLAPGCKPLELNYHVEELPPGCLLTAYGNALGDEVGTSISGTLRGIGPTLLEITAPIVGGYSGGPVIVTDKVIGVNTSGRMVAEDVWMTGSEYEVKQKTIGRNRVVRQPVIRRFATRVDNLTPDKLEVFDGEMQYNDLKLYRDLSRAVRVFVAEIVASRNPLTPEAAANRIFTPLGDFYNYKSHVKYIDELLSDYSKTLVEIFARTGISLNYLSDSERQTAFNMFRAITPYRKGYFDCPVCNGRGKVANPNAQLSSDFKNKYTSCKECEGKGRASGSFYDTPRGFSPGVVPVGQGMFGGMRTGWTEAMVQNKLKNEDSWQVTEFAGAVTMVTFDRNPTINARKTTAFFVMDKLAEITLVFDYSASLLQNLEAALTRQFGEPVHKLKKDNLEKILFKKGQQTVEMVWGTALKDGGISVRWYHNTLFELKNLLANDMGTDPYIKIRSRANEASKNVQQSFEAKAAERSPFSRSRSGGRSLY